jgi:hypothetical protein
VRFQALTATSTKMTVFWAVAPCSLVEVYRRFRDACNIPEDSHLHNLHRYVLWNNSIRQWYLHTLQVTLKLHYTEQSTKTPGHFCRQAKVRVHSYQRPIKAVLPLRRRDCDSIKKKVDYTLIPGESSSHRCRAGGRSAITKWRFDQ